MRACTSLFTDRGSRVAPRMGRLVCIAHLCCLALLQSTHPCVVRQARFNTRFAAISLQSTHPCGVRPAAATKHRDEQISFNPRTPCGVRPCGTSPSFFISLQSSHSAGGCDFQPLLAIGLSINFNPLTPHEASLPSSVYFVLSFNPRTPAWRDKIG